MNPLNASEFLSFVWPQSLIRNETLELRAIKRSDKAVSRRFFTNQNELLRVASQFGKGWDIYFGVSTRTGNSGKKEDCSRVRCTWVDLDNIRELPDFGVKLQPDIIVNSGSGYHVYWLLETPVFVRDEKWKVVESINRGLARRLNLKLKPLDPEKRYGADLMTVDITRILRIPDFYNFKYDPPKKVIANAVHT